MLNELLNTKLGRCFDGFDVDKDGVLEWADYERTAGRLAQAHGFAADSADAVRMLESYRYMWNLLLAPLDNDGDGRVSREEFLAAIEYGLVNDPEAYRMQVGPAAAAFFNLADTDGDGRVGAAEYVTSWTVLGISEPDLRQAFAVLDADGDGYLSRAEFDVAVAEFLTSDDPAARGNWLMGPL